MGVNSRRRLVTATAAAVTVLAAATGCGGDDAADDGTITLTVDVFGQFGYEELYKQYEADNPGIKIVERGTGTNLDEYSPS